MALQGFVMLDVSILGAFFGGILVFFSPCILPIVPFYLSYMAGVGMASFNEEENFLTIFDIELLFPQLHFHWAL